MSQFKTTTFKTLGIGDRFEFLSEVEATFCKPGTSTCRGPWTKISPRMYGAVGDPGFKCKVGTIQVEVVREADIPRYNPLTKDHLIILQRIHQDNSDTAPLTHEAIRNMPSMVQDMILQDLVVRNSPAKIGQRHLEATERGRRILMLEGLLK